GGAFIAIVPGERRGNAVEEPAAGEIARRSRQLVIGEAGGKMRQRLARAGLVGGFHVHDRASPHAATATRVARASTAQRSATRGNSARPDSMSLARSASAGLRRPSAAS